MILVGLWALLDLWVLPKVSVWAKAKVSELTADAPVDVKLGEVHLQLIPPRAEARDLLITPQGELARSLRPISISSVRARIDLFEIFLGRAQLSALVIENITGGLELDPLLENQGPAKPLPIAEIFLWTDDIPVRRVIVETGRWDLNSEKAQASGQIQIKDLSLINRGQQLRLVATLPSIQGQWKDLEALEAEAFVAAELNPRSLEVQNLMIRRNDTQLEARALIDDVAELPIKPRLRFTATAEMNLQQVGADLRLLFPEMNLPDLAGNLSGSTDVSLEGSTRFESTLRLRTEDVQIQNFKIGNAQLEGQLSQKAIQIKNVEINHPAGPVSLDTIQLEFQAPYAFRTLVKSPRFDLQALFQSLNLQQIPVDLRIQTNLPCEGSLSPLELRCQGKVTGDRLVVRTANRPDANVIVALKDLEANGEVKLNTKSVSFATDLRIGQSRGKAQGGVDFEAGYKVDFETPSVAFTDVENLSNLKFEGKAAIEGSTQGDAEAATFDLRMRTQDFVFENFDLGDVSGRLSYRAGHLIFEDLEMRKGRTQLGGFMDLDLGGSLIAGSFSSDLLDLEDVSHVFRRLFAMPVQLQSSGTARFEFDGPLDLWKMNYDLNAALTGVRVHTDQFDRMNLQISGRDGNLQIETAELIKNRSRILASGGISNTQELGISIDASALRLEESEIVTRFRSAISGQINAAAVIQGPLSNPVIQAKGAIADVFLEEQQVPSSFFNLNISRERLEGEMNLFGNRIQAEIQYPFGTNTSPLQLRVKTMDWAFTEMLSFVGASALQAEYRSRLTADVNLTSDTGRFQDVSGKIEIRNFLLERGDLSLKNPVPMEVLFNRGNMTLQNVQVDGPARTSVRIRGENFRFDNLDLNFFANVNLRLLHMFLPFLDDLGGFVRMEANARGPLWQPQILGNANFRGGFFRLKGFPHPIERLDTEIVFSQRRILIQGLQAFMAEGTIRGDGSVQINGPSDLPINLRLRGENLNLNVPEGIRTNGNADLTFAGRWFPYTLSGTYDVFGGVVELDPTAGGGLGGATASRASPYLPRVLRQAQFEPVVFDLQVRLDRGLAIRNPLMQGSISGRLQIKGPPQNPGILGRITTARGSRVVFRDREFELLTGSVNFTNANEINPELYLSAQSRVNEYDVNILIQGAARNPQITMTSLPPLPEQEIVSLLALGVTSTQTAQTPQTERQAQQQLGYEALGLGLSQTGLQKGLQSTVGVDVRITSTYDSIRNISVPKLSFTRTLSDRLDAVYLRPVNSDSNAQEFRLQYRLNSNVSAIGSYEQRDLQDGVVNRESVQKRESIFGLDLEFKREFR